MSYKTIIIILRQNQLILLETIFQQHKVTFRLLDESTNPNFPGGVKVQVEERDLKRAQALLKEHGFLQEPESGQSAVSMARFWLWLVISLFIIILASVIFNAWLH